MTFVGRSALATAVCILVAGALIVALPTDLPDTALAYYDFGSAVSGSIPNEIQGTGAPAAMAIRGSGFQLSNGEIVWNQTIGNFTFTFPFDPSRGTFAETPGSFPNAFSAGGTMGVRLRIDASVVTNLGQASSMGLITFRPDPDINIHRVPPRALEIKREGPTDPLFFLVREGNNSIGYNNEFNDEVRSGPLTNPAAEKTAIVVWNAQTLRIYVDGVLAGTTTRVTVDHPTPRYRIMAAVQPSLIHSGDNQFYKGAIKRLVLYNRVLTDLEIASLHAALSSNLPLPMAPKNLRITP